MALNIFKKLLLVAVSLVAGCQQPDYAIVTGEKGETVFVEVEVPGETVYVEVPEYIEVEVPVDHGEIWIDSFTQPMSVDGIDILWVIDRSGSMSMYNDELLNGIQAMLGALPTADWRLVMINADPTHSVHNTEFPLVPGDTVADAEAIRRLEPTYFANGGDRGKSNTPEQAVCEEIGVQLLWGVGGEDKVDSSSDLAKKVREFDVPPKRDKPKVSER